MQWESGFAGPAEINVIWNKGKRWSQWFYSVKKEEKISIWRPGLTAKMHK